VEPPAGPAAPSVEPGPVAIRAEDDRVAKLETEVTTLRGELDDLRQALADFRKQFE
jgi:hypothetical protein